MTFALSICPDKIFFVPNKIRFVLDKIFLSWTKILYMAQKSFLLWGNQFQAMDKIFVLDKKYFVRADGQGIRIKKHTKQIYLPWELCEAFSNWLMRFCLSLPLDASDPFLLSFLPKKIQKKTRLIKGASLAALFLQDVQTKNE